MTAFWQRAGRALAAAALATGAAAAPAVLADDDKPVFEQSGKASFYGGGFHGRKTASGERFDQNDLTAAHRSLPLGSEVTVTNKENGESVDVTINDRGPYVKGRIIDLSKRAAREIGIKDGIAPVQVEATREQLDAADDGDTASAQ